MAELTSDTIGGFNKYKNEQKALPGSVTFTLILFNEESKVVHNAVDLKDVPDLTSKVYEAGGWTAMNDALAEGIQSTGESLAAKPEEERPGLVIVLAMTDGLENSSKKYPGPKGTSAIREMVKHQTEKYNWSFVFMGANIDAKKVGGDLGVDGTCSMNYIADSAGVGESYKELSKGTQSLRKRTSKGQAKGDFFEDPNKVIGKP